MPQELSWDNLGTDITFTTDKTKYPSIKRDKINLKQPGQYKIRIVRPSFLSHKVHYFLDNTGRTRLVNCAENDCPLHTEHVFNKFQNTYELNMPQQMYVTLILDLTGPQPVVKILDEKKTLFGLIGQLNQTTGNITTYDIAIIKSSTNPYWTVNPCQPIPRPLSETENALVNACTWDLAEYAKPFTKEQIEKVRQGGNAYGNKINIPVMPGAQPGQQGMIQQQGVAQMPNQVVMMPNQQQVQQQPPPIYPQQQQQPPVYPQQVQQQPPVYPQQPVNQVVQQQAPIMPNQPVQQIVNPPAMPTAQQPAPIVPNMGGAGGVNLPNNMFETSPVTPPPANNQPAAPANNMTNIQQQADDFFNVTEIVNGNQFDVNAGTQTTPNVNAPPPNLFSGGDNTQLPNQNG